MRHGPSQERYMSSSETSQTMKKSKNAAENPYRQYGKPNRQTSVESGSDGHGQEFVIRKLPKQSADSRKKLM